MTQVVIFTDMGSVTWARSSGAYRIATEIRAAGYTVQVIDHFLMLGLERTLELLDKFVGPETLMVGFSTTFMGITAYHLQPNKPGEKRFSIADYVMHDTGSLTRSYSRGLPISSDDLKKIRERVLARNPRTKLVLGGTKADHHNQVEIDAFIEGYADVSVIKYLKYLEGKNPFFLSKRTSDGRIIIDDDVDATTFDFPNSIIKYEPSDLIQS